MSNFLKNALKLVERNMAQTASGLLVPPALVAGRHFGGFDGYEPWVQECIAAACEVVRAVPPDELSELTALVLYGGPGDAAPFVGKHSLVVAKLEESIEACAQILGLGDNEISLQAREQVRRAHGTRGHGTLLVVGVRWVDEEVKGELYKRCMLAISAWNTASIEEALAVPKQQYVLG